MRTIRHSVVSHCISGAVTYHIVCERALTEQDVWAHGALGDLTLYSQGSRARACVRSSGGWRLRAVAGEDAVELYTGVEDHDGDLRRYLDWLIVAL